MHPLSWGGGGGGGGHKRKISYFCFLFPKNDSFIICCRRIVIFIDRLKVLYLRISFYIVNIPSCGFLPKCCRKVDDSRLFKFSFRGKPEKFLCSICCILIAFFTYLHTFRSIMIRIPFQCFSAEIVAHDSYKNLSLFSNY